jgi:hypothetical protein
VYLGWFAGMSRAVQATSGVSAAPYRVPGVPGLITRASDKLASSGGGPAPGTTPGTSSHIAAIAYDHAGDPLAEVHVGDADAYDFTARFLAWSARRAAEDGVRVTGAAGPLEAFGLEAVQAGCRAAGLDRI